jgi:hypothetical protein
VRALQCGRSTPIVSADLRRQATVAADLHVGEAVSIELRGGRQHGSIVRESSARLRNEIEIVLGLGTVRQAEEEAFGMWHPIRFDVGFELPQIVIGELNIGAVEAFLFAAFGTVQLSHPTMQIGVFPPGVNIGHRARRKIHWRRRFLIRSKGIHFKSHFLFLSSVAVRPEGRGRKAGRHEQLPS